MNSVDHLNIADARPTFYPLLSQPVVEFCLAIPSWWNCRGGRDRAVARAAYFDRFPVSVSDRRTKGGFDGLLTSIVEEHRTAITSLVLGGRLAARRLIDVDAVRAVLDQRRPLGHQYGRILHLVDVEAWAAGWA